jgi:hypothetical protein
MYRINVFSVFGRNNTRRYRHTFGVCLQDAILQVFETARVKLKASPPSATTYGS